MKEKIFTIENLAKIISKKKQKGKKIVLCHGVFDLLHVGHIKHFKEAKNLGDILVVTITSDIYVNKGPERPVFNEDLRLEAVAALEDVDYVGLNCVPTAINIIKKIRPNIYCKGPDYKNYKDDISGQIKNEIEEVKKIGSKIVHTTSKTYSSSKLINTYDNFNSSKQKILIEKIKKNYTFLKIKKMIDSFKKLKILIIGETIIDQYVFCDALGKSGKDSVLVFKDINTEEYLGGAAALARHLSPFSNKISLLSMIGEKDNYLSKIKKKLPRNINFQYIKKKNSPTILKKRFLDRVNKNKVFGVYKINDENLDKEQDKLLNNTLKKMLPKHDLVIVSDYGHGFISKQNANLICKLSKYLSLNAQVNAANIGYHSMRNYKNLDCVIINKREMHHEMRDKNNKTTFLMKKFSAQQKIDNLIVTQGSDGAMMYNRKSKKFNFSKAYAKNVVDKIGAGDAMLSIVAPCLKIGFNNELSLLIGSLAGGQSAETMGNKETTNKNHILKILQHLLK